MGLGRVYPGDPNEPFCMTVLALKLSRHANGVSALHGRVSRRMWQPLYPEPDRGGGADRPHHQRRPRPELAGPADAPALTTATSASTGPSGCATPRPGTASRRRRRRALGDAAGPQGPADRLRPPPPGRAGHAAATRARRRSQRAAQVARPRRPDHRLRPPVRHLQAGRPGPPATSSGSPSWSTPPTARSSSSSPARPTPRTSCGKELIQNIVRLTRDERVRRTGSSSSRTTT